MAENQPFLKYPGGKRWLAPKIKEIINGVSYCRYVEPFLGGGAVFFTIKPDKALLSDINGDLINTYQSVQKNADTLISELKKLRATKNTYYRWRSEADGSSAYKAVRFLFLNRTAFGGIYRLNRNGQFNVPFGGGERKHSILWKNNLLSSASKMLANAKITCNDFAVTLKSVKKGDLVYCDPTYTVAHNNNGFRRYNENNFTWDDQIRLASLVEQVAKENKVPILVSNAFHKEIEELYPNAKKLVFSRPSCVCPIAGKRTSVDEYLLTYNL